MSENAPWYVAVAQWFMTALGPVGFVTVIFTGLEAYAIWLMWKRLKEKDAECQETMKAAQLSWDSRLKEMREDVKEAFEMIGDLTKQVTTLVVRGGGMRT